MPFYHILDTEEEREFMSSQNRNNVKNRRNEAEDNCPCDCGEGARDYLGTFNEDLGCKINMYFFYGSSKMLISHALIRCM